ncbi:hypothetical protein BJX61DRAFT_260684 [Aspergillus egyptiacus]|nr:hypothetical protein BJX61DRAFT_260684 [Aspergillus egyptiacus]
MHRRTIVQLSRRHGAEWPSAARLRDPAVVCSPRRCFHPSLPCCNTSGLPPSNKPDNQAPSANSTGTPKFGAPKFVPRWGSRQTSQPATLSAQEQAIRDALVSRTEEQKKKAEEEKKTERLQRAEVDAIWRSQRARRQPYAQPLWQGDTQKQSGDGHSLRVDDKRRGDKRFVFLKDKESQDLQPLKKFEVKGPNTIAKQLRITDWICPDCSYTVYGKHKYCPKCNARRPVPRTLSLRPQPRPEAPSAPSPESIQPSGEPSVLRKIEHDTPGIGGEPVSGLSPKENALRRHLAAEQAEKDGSPRGRKWNAPRYQSEEPRQTGAEETKAKETEVQTDPWSWDVSLLDRLKLEEDRAAQDRKSKHPGRRQRESRDDEEEFDVEEHNRRREERKRLKKERSRRKVEESAPSPLYLPEFISVSNLADVFGLRPAQFVQRLEEMGFEDVTYSHVLDAETAGLIATEFGFEPVFDTGAEADLTAAPVEEDKSHLPPRPPVVTIMGHVDHGKTTLLDWLRKSSVVASEHGGITQHIGAFSVSMPSGKNITFLDTPGHAAFLEMRRRGAVVTDIVVLVVAADDSVKPQTVEAIKHATSANVPIIVAISKIDKEGINPEKVKQDLSVHGIHVEDYGGDVQAIGVSGKTGQGMLELEEAIITLSEVLDHRADPDGVVEGWVVEASTKSYGRVATVLVRRGTLRPGDIIVAGSAWARVRTLRNEAGISVSEATPGTPVEVDGWREQPLAGSEFLQAEDEQHAKEVIDYRLERADSQKLSVDTAAINEARREQLEKRQKEGSDKESEDEKQSGPKPVHFVIKADVAGSAEAVMNSVTALGNNEVYANVLRSEVGQISEFDIEHAAAANGHIISFNMPIDPSMSRMAESKGVRILDYNIIYKLVDEVRETLSAELTPIVTQRVTGEAEVGQIFEITVKARVKTLIAGCKVRNGVINRARKVRVLRGQETVYDGTISSLKNVKKDVTEMRKDTECGIAFEDWTEFAVGDQIQCYEEIFEKRYV